MKNKIIYILLSLCVVTACNDDEDFDFGEKATGDFEFSEFEFNSTIFTFTPVGVDPDEALVSWDFGYSESEELTDRSVEFSPLMQFPEAGTYTVTLILTNDAGISTVKKQVTVSEPDPDALPLEFFFITTFGDPNGKTWVIDKDNDGHSGAGRSSATTPNIWSRPAGAMECLGLYNDEYTFRPDLGFVFETGGDIYTRNGFQGEFNNPQFQSAVCDPALGLSGNDIVAEYTAPTDLTWSVKTLEDGTRVLTLSAGGYIGMAVGQTQYELQVLSDNEMYLRFLQGSIAWYKRLIPKS